jgi:hypothetical protein
MNEGSNSKQPHPVTMPAAKTEMTMARAGGELSAALNWLNGCHSRSIEPKKTFSRNLNMEPPRNSGAIDDAGSAI